MYVLDHFFMESRKGVKRNIVRKKGKPVALNCLVAVKTMNPSTMNNVKDVFWFSYRSVLLKDFQLNFETKKPVNRTVTFGAHLLLNIMECMSPII